MHKLLKALRLLDINFHLFGEGGEGTAGSGAQGDSNSEGQNSTLSDNSGDFSNIVFGKPSPEEAANTNSTPAAGEETATAEDLNAQFQELVNGKFKQQYTDATQKMINRRFSESKQMQAQLEKQDAIIENMWDRYPGVEYGDYDGLHEAMQNDTGLFAQTAEEEGYTEEQFSQIKELRAENRKLNKEKADFERWRENKQQAEYAQSVTDRWQKEAIETKKEFSDFNFNEEVKNKDFVNLLRSGFPIRKAYVALHADEIMESRIKQQARDTERQITDDIRARGSQPLEAAATSGSNFTRMSDPSTWTDAMLEEVARRVEEEGAQIHL